MASVRPWEARWVQVERGKRVNSVEILLARANSSRCPLTFLCFRNRMPPYPPPFPFQPRRQTVRETMSPRREREREREEAFAGANNDAAVWFISSNSLTGRSPFPRCRFIFEFATGSLFVGKGDSMNFIAVKYLWHPLIVIRFVVRNFFATGCWQNFFNCTGGGEGAR